MKKKASKMGGMSDKQVESMGKKMGKMGKAIQAHEKAEMKGKKKGKY